MAQRLARFGRRPNEDKDHESCVGVRVRGSVGDHANIGVVTKSQSMLTLEYKGSGATRSLILTYKLGDLEVITRRKLFLGELARVQRPCNVSVGGNGPYFKS